MKKTKTKSETGKTDGLKELNKELIRLFKIGKPLFKGINIKHEIDKDTILDFDCNLDFNQNDFILIDRISIKTKHNLFKYFVDDLECNFDNDDIIKIKDNVLVNNKEYITFKNNIEKFNKELTDFEDILPFEVFWIIEQENNQQDLIRAFQEELDEHDKSSKEKPETNSDIITVNGVKYKKVD